MNRIKQTIITDKIKCENIISSIKKYGFDFNQKRYYLLTNKNLQQLKNHFMVSLNTFGRKFLLYISKKYENCFLVDVKNPENIYLMDYKLGTLSTYLQEA